MKIKTIRLLNLNSLRTEQVLNFDEPPLAEAGIFAITGDTGAGKSTILDALTLALYGQVPRNAQEGEIMSYGTGKSLAEVEFEVGEECYRSKWSIWRAREKAEGNLQDSRRELARWNPEKQVFEIIGEKKREVGELIVEITGLDYDRFCRSVLLSQGDFAAFLKADERDRSELLERITGTAIYSELSKAAFERHKLEKQELDALEKELEVLELLSEEEATALAEQVDALRKETSAQQKKEQRLRDQVNWLAQLQKLQQKEVNLRAQSKALEEEATAFQPKAAQLQLHQKALPLQLSIHRLGDATDQKQQLDAAIAAGQEELPILQQKAEQAKASTEAATEQLKAAKAAQREQAPVLERVKALDLKIQNQRAPLEKQRQGLAKAQTDLDQTRAQHKILTAELEAENKQAKEVSQWLEDHANWANLSEDLPSIREQRQQLIESFQEQQETEKQLKAQQKALEQQTETLARHQKKVDQLKRERDKAAKALEALAPKSYTSDTNTLLEIMHDEIAGLTARQTQLEKLQSLSQEYEKLLTTHSDLEAELEQLQARDRIRNTELLGTLDQIDELQRTRQYRSRIFEQQRAIANYEKDRADLEAGEPCPLCLSTTHPFREEAVEPFVDEARAELQRVEAKLEKAQQHQRKLLTEQQQIELRMEQLQGDEKKAIAGQLRQQYEQLVGYEEQIAALQPEEGERVKSAFLSDEIKGLETQLKQRQRDRKQLGQVLKSFNEVEADLAKAERSHQDAAAEQRMLNNEVERLKKEQTEKARKFEAGTERINQLLERYGFEFQLDTAKQMFQTLEKRRQAWAEHQQQTESLAKSIAVKQTQVEQLSQQLQERQAALQDQQATVVGAEAVLAQLQNERQELFGDKDPVAVAQGLQEQQEQAEAKREAAQAAAAQAKQSLVTAKSSLEEKQAQQKVVSGKLEKLAAELEKAAQSAGFDNAEAAQSALLPEVEAQQLETKAAQLQQRQQQNEQALKDTQTELEQEKTRALTDQSEEALEAALATATEELSAQQQRLGALTEQQRRQTAQKEKAAKLADKLDAQRKGYRRWAELNDIIGQADGKKFRMFAQGLTLQKLTQLANRHLQQLHGRYLIRKREGDTLDLDIVDTYQADNQRSMNTLSGGESFLVSLALALGLSELAGRDTQLQSLFIDEGFGTLDENTLDLAIATLENLQARGKTIGIISHVKALKERIAAQVQVVKQGNGFSTVQVVA